MEPLRARVLGYFGVGFNHIDIEAAKHRNLTVTNTPDVLTDCPADIAMTLENVVLLPHLGSATVETRVAMGMRVSENVSAFFAGETPRDRVV